MSSNPEGTSARSLPALENESESTTAATAPTTTTSTTSTAVANANAGGSAVARTTDAGHNAATIVCRFCQCKVFLAGVASHVALTDPISLPLMLQPKDSPTVIESLEASFWRLGNQMDFENVTVARNMPGTTFKYLACGACEIGPFGYFDNAVQPHQFFVAVGRVQEHQP
ncbi:hypothetical protein CAOG_05999 [Capsaspora owczarzaki ATCC 30864]|uniref:Mss4-like protein n=1 Tax=Capsaspora owczarzaki (strain ATCC 30864) TaxID=595528 RepID=A0A0D2UKD7_CAPO3|nr:hypothetical protein CAOG_05999 [Capsaspora owczarzaki ATCC 30864]KJE95556.1 hypothetical protein CAOG_005999 [Capsaspora owczarzaki ATCC 30864]|eukprot:XP_004345589.1 hypothetical protein CAOG_05999 [Capsaspora owczarzaki ATCC 30864]